MEPRMLQEVEEKSKLDLNRMSCCIQKMEEENHCLVMEKDSWKEKYWDTLTRLEMAHKLVNVHHHNVAQYRDEWKVAEEEKEAAQKQFKDTDRELVNTQKLLEASKKELENKQNITDEVCRLNVLLATLKQQIVDVQHEKEEIERYLNIDLEKLRSELHNAQAILNIEKNTVESQTVLHMLNTNNTAVQASQTCADEAIQVSPEMIDIGVQVISDRDHKDSQAVVNSYYSSTQTMEQPSCSCEVQTVDLYKVEQHTICSQSLDDNVLHTFVNARVENLHQTTTGITMDSSQLDKGLNEIQSKIETVTDTQPDTSVLQAMQLSVQCKDVHVQSVIIDSQGNTKEDADNVLETENDNILPKNETVMELLKDEMKGSKSFSQKYVGLPDAGDHQLVIVVDNDFKTDKTLEGINARYANEIRYFNEVLEVVTIPNNTYSQDLETADKIVVNNLIKDIGIDIPTIDINHGVLSLKQVVIDPKEFSIQLTQDENDKEPPSGISANEKEALSGNLNSIIPVTSFKVDKDIQSNINTESLNAVRSLEAMWIADIKAEHRPKASKHKLSTENISEQFNSFDTNRERFEKYFGKLIEDRVKPKQRKVNDDDDDEMILVCDNMNINPNDAKVVIYSPLLGYDEKDFCSKPVTISYTSQALQNHENLSNLALDGICTNCNILYPLSEQACVVPLTPVNNENTTSDTFLMDGENLPNVTSVLNDDIATSVKLEDSDKGFSATSSTILLDGNNLPTVTSVLNDDNACSVKLADSNKGFSVASSVNIFAAKPCISQPMTGFQKDVPMLMAEQLSSAESLSERKSSSIPDVLQKYKELVSRIKPLQKSAIQKRPPKQASLDKVDTNIFDVSDVRNYSPRETNVRGILKGMTGKDKKFKNVTWNEKVETDNVDI